jgi:hypothetical protein
MPARSSNGIARENRLFRKIKAPILPNCIKVAQNALKLGKWVFGFM